MTTKIKGQAKEKNSDMLELANRQLLENQSFLHKENQKLQEDVTRLSQQLEYLRETTVNPEIFEALKQEKNSLLSLNETLKHKIKRLKSTPAQLTNEEIEREQQEKLELYRSVQNLDKILEKMNNQSEKMQILTTNDHVDDTIHTLTKKLELEQKKCEQANELLRKLRSDDEKYILREKIADMKQLITDLEVENTKLKFESEQLAEDIENYKKELREAVEEAKTTSKKNCQLEDEKEKLKQTISNLENDNIRLKKEMIEELNEANRAKRVSIDTEIALQHISEAYENKRKEVMQLREQIDDAEQIIKGFRDQFEPHY